MPGSSSAVPKKAYPSNAKRRFTVDEANRTLPLVKRIVGDIVRTHTLVSQLHQQLETPAPAAAQQKTQDELESQIDRLNEYVGELAAVGCDLKDYQAGLVDFLGRHKGRDICLCWKLGEEKIEYWHEMQTGFAGRQPVATLEEE
ncbi:MAG TPA: DUF2203 domain-containing protein [Tepidisphaeraceae bacterium]|nr:DUF2203 domain-containing protein [Tepidisphaeraceae bacterium]